MGLGLQGNESSPELWRRIARHPLTLIAIGGAILVLVTGSFSALGGRVLDLQSGWPNLGWMLLTTLAVVAAWKVYKRWVEREPDREYSLRNAHWELGGGLLFGIVLFSATAGIVALLGGMEIVGVRPVRATDLAEMLGMAVMYSVFEETLFRGLILRQLERMSGKWFALGVTSMFFGYAHLANPNATLFAAVAVAVEAGILLGAAYFLTRRLWLAIGIHAGWNFTQGWVFSVPVSGGPAPEGWLISARSGPNWLTGGGFGIEASAIAFVMAALAGGIMLWIALRREGLANAA